MQRPAQTEPGAAASEAPPPSGPARRLAGRVFASPLARRLARQVGVPLGRIRGTGPDGRVVARDIRVLPLGGAGLDAPPTSGRGFRPACSPAVEPPADAAAFDFLPTPAGISLVAGCDLRACMTLLANLDRAARAAGHAGEAEAIPLTALLVKALAVALRRKEAGPIGITVAGSDVIEPRTVAEAGTIPLSRIAGALRGGSAQPGDRPGAAASPSGIAALLVMVEAGGVRQVHAPVRPPYAVSLALAAGEAATLTLSCDERKFGIGDASALVGDIRGLIESPMGILA